MTRKYLAGDEWFESLDAAHASIASRLGVDASGVEALRRRISIDPLVVRRDDGRWRSAAVWMYRSAAGSVRVAEMIHVDEAAYEHDH